MSTPGVLTILFTDLVRSTELLDSMGDEQWEPHRRRHFETVRRVVAAHNGEEVKTIGDSFMVVFTSPADAVSCAVAIQQAVEYESRAGAGPEIQVRVGAHVGEPTREGDDYFGAPVVIARRLCDRAGGGEILVSEVVRALVGSRGSHTFKSTGPLELKGFEEPVAACEVAWDPDTRSTIPLPGALVAGERPPWAGRDDDRQRLRDEWASAKEGALRLVLLAGEPGIGKTRLATEAALEAHVDGATVLFGRCDEEALVPYQPFVEMLRHYLAHAPATDLDALTPFAGHLARLAPEASLKLPVDYQPADPETERYLMFEAVASFLRAAASAGPIVLLFDDLHWADKPTLLLLRHVLRAAAGIPALVLGTYRDTDLDRRHPLAAMLADLRRDAAPQRLSLRGLSLEDVVTLLEARAAHDLDDPGRILAAVLRDETEGNPLFIWETLRHLIETGVLYERDGRWTSDATTIEALGIPEGVKEAIGRRLSRLSETCTTVLGCAAVLGRDVDAEVLIAMTGVDDDAVFTALEEAVAAQLLAELELDSRPAYSFTHALVRQTLYEELSVTRRQRLHRRALDAIEQVHARQLERHLPSLAHHAIQAGAAVDPSIAVGYAERAGNAAGLGLAWEEALAHWDAARELMEEHGATPLERARLLERIGDVMYLSGVDYLKGINHLEAALDLYDAAGLHEKAAQMHSRLCRDLSTLAEAVDIGRARAHIEAAAPLLETGPERPAQAHFFASRATMNFFGNLPASRDDARRAREIAERLGNDRAWATGAVLEGWAAQFLGQPDVAQGLIEQAWEVADRAQATYVVFLAAWFRAICASTLLDPKGFWLAEEELGRPRFAQAPTARVILSDMVANGRIYSGDLDGAEAVLATKPDSLAAGTNVQPLLLFHRGDWDAAAAQWQKQLDESTERGTGITSGWTRWGLGRMAASEGRLDDAEAIFRDGAEFGESIGDRLHRIILHGPELAYLAAVGGRTEEARELLAHGEPDDPTIFGAAVHSRHVARGAIAAAEGRREAADAEFAEATRVTSAIPLYRASDIWRWGRVLLPDDPLAAREKFDAAERLFRQHGAGGRWLELLAEDRAKAGA